MLNIILLSGGSGKRLWPLSNDVRSKQFIKIFKKPDGSYESMVQRMYQSIRALDHDAKVTIATSRTQVSAIHNQLGTDVGISVEPCRRDTFPAIALAAAYLHDVQHVAESEAVVVCPVDPYVDNAFFGMLEKLGARAAEGKENLVLMGIKPTEPSDKYGYIMPEMGGDNSQKLTERTVPGVNKVDSAVMKQIEIAEENIEENTAVRRVRTFKEKPDVETARKYIAEGALWNGGIFAFKLGYVLDIARRELGYTDYQDLFDRYETLPKISFDYAVVEKEPRISVMEFSGRWEDIGTWNTFTDAMQDPTIGDATMSDSCEDVHVLNELDVPVLVMGMKDTIVSASPQGILVSSKEASTGIKPYVEKMNQRIMFAEKSWGVFHVLDVEDQSLTIKANIKAGDHMTYHSHERRDEVWIIIAGRGRTIVDGMEQIVEPGDVVTMQAGCKHTIEAITDLKLIEVQLGKDIRVSDKKRYVLEEPLRTGAEGTGTSEEKA